MLAKIDWNSAPCEPVADIDYTGFPYWVALAAEPNRERKAADWLKDHVNIHVYWPNYGVQKIVRNRPRREIRKSVLPGVLFAPSEIMEIGDRNAILDWARLRIVRLARFITKAEIKVIQEIEAALIVCRSQGGDHGFKVNDPVCFIDEVEAAFLGDATVIAIASAGRITVRLKAKLIGTDIITVPAAKLKAM